MFCSLRVTVGIAVGNSYPDGNQERPIISLKLKIKCGGPSDESVNKRCW
jgi:hypothetical protein